jgi:uncharacterized protein YjiS (DUF1127 family)
MWTTIIHPRPGRAAPSDGFRPASPLWGANSGLSVISVWIARSRQRRALRELAECSDRDHLLDDIGVTPEQARRAAAKWFWQP